MANDFVNNAGSLRELLEGMTKRASETVEEIKDPVAGQTAETKEQQKEIDEASPAPTVSDASTQNDEDNDPGYTPSQEEPKVENAKEEVESTAATKLAHLKAIISKKAAQAATNEGNTMNVNRIMNKAASVLAPNAGSNDVVITATECLHKAASLKVNDAEGQNELYGMLGGLYATNPVFKGNFEKIAARKMAEDIAALQSDPELAGVPEDALAEQLNAELAADPEAAQALQEEVTGEALGETAAAEDEAVAFDQMADEISAETGVDKDSLLEMTEAVMQAAEETGEDPETIVQVLVEQAEGGEPAVEEAVEEAAPAEEEMAKDASLVLVGRAYNNIKNAIKANR